MPLPEIPVKLISILARNLRESSFFEFFVDDVGRGRVQVRFDGLERVPTTDLHHDSRVHLLLDEKSLREAPAEIVAADVAVPLDARVVCRRLGGSLQDGTDALGR